MIAWLSLAFGAADSLQSPVYLEPVVGVPRVCVSMVPTAGKFKGKDAKTWAEIKSLLVQGKYEAVEVALARLKKDHPAKRSVELAIQVIDEDVHADVDALVAAAPEDACVRQTAALVKVTEGDVEAAGSHVDEAFRLAPDDPDIVLLLTLLRPEHDPSGQRARLEAAVQKSPNHAALRLIAGRSALEAEDMRASVDHFARAFELGVSDISELVLHLRRVAGFTEDYLAQVSTLNMPMDIIDFSAAKAGQQSYVEAYDQGLGIGKQEELVASIATSKGVVECKLLHRQAPVTVANFVGLARGKQATEIEARNKQPFYDGLIFHRVIPGFMIQGGDPSGDGSGNPGYTFLDEVDPALLFDRPGLLAMANSGPGTNGSQFFITDAAAPHLNGRRTIFGRCKPLERISTIARVEADRDTPVEPVVIESIRVDSRPIELEP